jgi:thiol-disulfide isomerase/thioredoxin
MRSPVMGFVAVTNGETTWVYLPALNQYIKQPTAEVEKNGLSMIKDSFSNLSEFGGLMKAQVNELRDVNKRVKRARILREETIYPQGEGIDCVVVEVEQEPTEGLVKGEAVSPVKTLWIEKDRLLIARQQTVLKMKDAGEGEVEVKTVSVLRSARLNEPVAESSFTFAPPSGAKLVESLAQPRGDNREPTSPFVGKEAEDFKLKDPSGKKVELKSLRGKVVMLDFWATWCLPCRDEMPHLEKLYREFKDKGLVVVGINVEDAKTARAFMKQFGYTFLTLIDDGNVSVIYRVEGIPTVFVIDKDGKITDHYVGAQSEEELRGAIKRAGLE